MTILITTTTFTTWFENDLPGSWLPGYEGKWGDFYVRVLGLEVSAVWGKP